MVLMHPVLSMRNFKRLVSILLLACLFFGGAGFLSRQVEIPTGRIKTSPFLNEERQYDVLLFGTSHVVNGFLPMQLWKEFGIRSYNLGIHGGSVASSYWALRLATQKVKPKVAVLDVLNVEETENVMELGLMHPALDPYPLSKTKIQAVLDLYPAAVDRMELLFPLDIYHSRWKELDALTMLETPQLSIEKGAEAMLGRKRVDSPVYDPELALETTWAMGYLERFIRCCQDQDIIPVITYIPFCYEGSGARQRYCNAAMKLAQELGALTLNIQDMHLTDPNSDWSDKGGHLNATGAYKVTQVLGQWLRKNIDLPDGTQDAQWAQDHSTYRDKWLYRLTQYTEPAELLNIASLLDADVIAELPQGSELADMLMSFGARVTESSEADLALRLTVLDDDGEILVSRSYAYRQILAPVDEA